MGAIEFQLFLMYGLPLIIKLLNEGRTDEQTTKAVAESIAGLKNSNVKDSLLNATPEQQESIVNGLYGVIAGAGNALDDIVKTFSNLLKKNK